MGIVKKLLGRSGGGPRQGSGEEDPLSLDRFGGSWETALAHAIVGLDDLPDLITFIKTGEPWEAGRPYYWGQYRTRPVTLLTAAAAMTSDERANFGRFLGRGWSLDQVLAQFAPSWDRRNSEPNLQPTIAQLEALAPRFGWAAGEILQSMLSLDRYSGSGALGLSSYPDFNEFVSHNRPAIAAALTPANHNHVQIWRRLANLSEDNEHALAPQICDAATAGSKAIRSIGLERLASLPPHLAEEHLKALALDGKASQRAEAVRVLTRVAGQEGADELRRWTAENLAGDRAKAVRDAVAALDQQLVAPATRPDLPSISLPIVRALPNSRNLLDVVNGKPAQDHGRRYNASQALRWALERDLSAVQLLTPAHVARSLLVSADTLVYAGRAIATGLQLLDPPSPLEISAVADHDEEAEAVVVQVVTHLYATKVGLWSVDDLRPWVDYHAQALADAIANQQKTYQFDRDLLLATLADVDPLPPVVTAALVQATVGGYKAERSTLQRMIGVDHLAAILPFLESRKRTERRGAAEWVRANPTPDAVDRLLAAARAEKDDQVKSAMLMALEALDQPLDEFVGPEALLADATKALAKKSGIPKAMSWLTVESLPPLSWADGSPVDQQIVTWFLASAVKNKTAEPSPVLRRHFDNMDPTEVRVFGAALLDLWLAEDLRTQSPEEARAIADANAPRYHQWAQSGHQPQFANMTITQISDELYRQNLSVIAGSATTSKGLLAVVAASADGSVADRCLAYIRKHRGHRVSQAKVLLEMLAWIDEPTTVQAVMSVAVSFRPKGIQDEAHRQAELLAERHGWTLDDLADRSVPTGGFEANGRQAFDYGDRTFTAHLADDLTISLINDETNKQVRSLPNGRADEDPELIKEAKREFSAAKKELKNATRLQPGRLYQAMCIQRTWSVDDFNRYFLDHPVVARLATRLVWVATEGSGEQARAVAFRPLTDGTLVDADDDDVTPSEHAMISVAHKQTLGAEQGAAWDRHFTDYEVTPLFSQFNRPSPVLAPKQTVFREFRGHMHNDGSLRGQMNRYAWELGPPMDAGIVGELIKRVPAAGLTAVLTLEGGIPAGAYDVGSWPCALGDLFFVPSRVSYYQPSDAVPLEEVPPILLTEFYAEVRAMADAGTGFDPESSKKVNG